jgi:hypothetical protein
MPSTRRSGGRLTRTRPRSRRYRRGGKGTYYGGGGGYYGGGYYNSYPYYSFYYPYYDYPYNSYFDYPYYYPNDYYPYYSDVQTLPYSPNVVTDVTSPTMVKSVKLSESDGEDKLIAVHNGKGGQVNTFKPKISSFDEPVLFKAKMNTESKNSQQFLILILAVLIISLIVLGK